MIVDPGWRAETMKVIIKAGTVVRMSTAIPRTDYSATYLGITAFSRHIAATLFDEIGRMPAEGQANEFFNAAVQNLVDRGLRVGFTSTYGLPWAEIDNPADLEYARTCVYPRLRKLAGPPRDLARAVA